MSIALSLLLGCSRPDLPSPNDEATAIDADGDGYAAGVDCDDANPGIGNGMPWVADADQDGFTDPEIHQFGCDPGPGWVIAEWRAAVDCDDSDPTVGTAVLHYFDLDGDGEASREYREYFCGQAPPGWYVTSDDCDDEDPTIFPGQVEQCDEIDNDCSDVEDDGDVCPVDPVWHLLNHVVLDTALLPTGEVATVGLNRSLLYVTDPVLGTQTTHSVPFEPEHVAVSASGALAVVASRTEIAWVRLPTGAVSATADLDQWPRDMVVTDQQRVYVVDQLGTVVYHPTAGALQRVQHVSSTSIVLHPDGSDVYIDADHRYRIEADGTLTFVRSRFQAVGAGFYLTMDPNGERMYTTQASYLATEDPETDMLYVGGLVPLDSWSSPLALSPSTRTDRVYGMFHRTLVSYNRSNLVEVGSYTVPDPEASSTTARIDRGFQFASDQTEHVVVVAEVDDGPGDADEWAAIAVPYTSLP